MIRAVLYTHRDDPQAEAIRQMAQRLQEQVPHRLVEVHVDGDAALAQRLGDLPLLVIGPYRLRPPFTETDLLITLRAARDRQQRRQTTATPDPFTRRVEGLVWWLANHWLLVANLLVFLYVGLPFLAPVLMKAHLETPARWIYRAYGLTCHQLAFRSWFLFGEQPAYPRTAAQIPNLIPFGQATGLDENDLLAARAFLGNEQLGYKVALCQRDVAIYGSILLFGLLYGLARRRWPRLPGVLWLLVGVLPIALDGFSQLFSQLPGAPLPYRESTPFLRTLTGFLFGFTTAWFGYPLVEEAMADTRALIAPRRQREQHPTSEPAPAPEPGPDPEVLPPNPKGNSRTSGDSTAP